MEQAGADLAAAMPEPDLKVRDQAPGFRLTNARGPAVALADLLAKGAVVLTFYRGAWCPYCNLQRHGLAQSLPAIEAAGDRLVAIIPQTPDKSLGQVEKDGYPFEILSDLDSQVMYDSSTRWGRCQLPPACRWVAPSRHDANYSMWI